MRKHLTPYWPVVRCIRTHIQPVVDVFKMQDATQPLVFRFADIVFTGSEHNAHFPEIGVVVVYNKIHGIVEIHGVAVKSVDEPADVKSAAHGKAVTGQVRMTEGSIYSMVTAETASGEGHSFVARFMLRPGNQFGFQHMVITGIVMRTLLRGNGFVVPGLIVQTIGAVDLHFAVFNESFYSINHSLVLILVIGPLRCGK